MIFSNINSKNGYSNLNNDLLTCLEYAKNNSLVDFEKGKHEIDGDNLFVNIVEYETCEREERFWEAHKDYIDVHLMLRGTEIIDVNFIDNMEQGEYKKSDDFLALEGKANSHVQLKEGDFLVCYPEDGHMTAIRVEERQEIKKAIFKVIIR